MHIVPIGGPRLSKVEDGFVRWLPPRQCFFGDEPQARFHSKLFEFVDFGTAANSFLSACGTKREPSVEEIAQILLEDPRKFYELANGRDK
jgi:Protein of unknown function (DUF3684)